MEKIKIAVIGLGGIAQIVHLPNLIKTNNVSIAAVAEINKNRLNTIADKFNIRERYTSYEELLEKSDSDAVIVATPTSTHKDITIAVLQAKKDVLVEKPLARSYEEAKPIVEAARKYKRKIMVGMNLRYRPDAMLLRSLIRNNEIGIPLYVKCGWFRSQSSKGEMVYPKGGIGRRGDNRFRNLTAGSFSMASELSSRRNRFHTKIFS